MAGSVFQAYVTCRAVRAQVLAAVVAVCGYRRILVGVDPGAEFASQKGGGATVRSK